MTAGRLVRAGALAGVDAAVGTTVLARAAYPAGAEGVNR